MQSEIQIKGAKVHNLKNVSINIPKNQLVVMTGVSGSGKSSLAFDTLYAEGQRRYVESLSSYARQFLGLMEKPDVEAITGLSPAISIDQKTSGSNPRSTVGTVTEIYDYLRLLYAQIGETHCPNCGRPVKAQTIHEIANKVMETLRDGVSNKSRLGKIQILSPIIQRKKGTYSDLFDNLLSKGFLRVRIDGEIHSLDESDTIKLDKNKKHTIDLIVDRLVSPSKDDLEKTENETFKEFEKRLTDAIELASNMAEGESKVLIDGKEYFYSENNTCFKCKISFPKIKPASFSFNSPHGACPKCTGLGILKEIDADKLYNPRLSILEG
ncbi:excinuclease ABC subunit UvrA, partial [Candidatus Dojkabacteria bacterium]|nr:excinuclease ABC subunit UvrA [Candidatus Dojkabacteria bacterium]